MNKTARRIYETIRHDPIVSPHGHCEPSWFADDAAFPDPTTLILTPDHYLFRMLLSQGVSLADIGIGTPPDQRDNRAIWNLFAAHWDRFLGTPSHSWLTYMFRETFGCDLAFGPDTADEIYDHIDAALKTPGFRPRALFRSFNIETLATTDAATDPLVHHQTIRDSGWEGRVIPTFRPDALFDPADARFAPAMAELEKMHDIEGFPGFLDALRQRRAHFKALGATATDHAQEVLRTAWIPERMGDLYAKARKGTCTAEEAADFNAHMLVESARMSCDDGLVMQIHAGSRRNTNAALLRKYGRDMGADIPVATDWVRGLGPLLDQVGHVEGFNMILFTLDESTYSRELAPMAGHWPCLRIGPPWWFHDSARGIARYFDRVVETAGYHNLAGFNDDTRAFCSIPARHDVWRQGVATHLGKQVKRGLFGIDDATRIAGLLSTGLARSAYRLEI
ncbi:glucuronate isomerase [Oceaniglobus trochenteri]|uniref:glucuronate isomerase n=1 Tax=Oceaniglobus trochenteri TaxID=2763260 RepID=UPI001CFF6526|nr:glucuronate isomerase [Oceaniglobus trochenteri]